MTWLKNYWVQKRYRTQVVDNEWMLFVWGLPAISMLNALEQVSRKTLAELKISEDSETLWTAVDPVSDTRYIVERRDDQPAIPEGAKFSVRDQTIPVNLEKKAMPKAGSLFAKQLDLF